MVALRLLSLLAVLIIAVADVAVEENGDFEYPALSEDYSEHEDHVYHGGSSDYQYHDEYYPKLGNNITLHKCLCGVNQVWSGSSCQDHDQDTLVAVLDHISNEVFVLGTSSFGNVTVQEVICPEGMLEIHLGKSTEHPVQFFIDDSGRVSWDDHSYEHYCVEHYYGPDGQANQWYAQVCLQQPLVPRCCAEGHSLTSNGSCVVSQAYQFLPPISVALKPEVWPAESLAGVANISCEESEEMMILDLDSSTTHLWYHPSTPHLLWKSPVNRQEFRLDYCVGVKEGSEQHPKYVAKLCFKDPIKDHEETCTNNTCVRKCCGPSEIAYHHGCQSASEDEIYHPEFHHSSSLSPGAPAPSDLTFVYGMPLCEDFFQLDPHKQKDDNFYLFPNGYLHAPAFPDPFPPTSYCIDVFLKEEEPNQHQYVVLPLICFEDRDRDSDVCIFAQTYLYPALLLVSVVFLSITLLVYLIIPELHAKVHGKCLVSHVTALLMAYVSLFIVQRTTKSLSIVACKFMASVTHVSFLAAFFWLNVMCFDIWWTLKSMRPVPETGELSRLRFKLYSVYSWGCPVVIAVVSVIMQNLPETADVIRPDFGTTKCWFSDNASKWAYFYGFVLLLVIVNIIFFCQVAHILIVAQNDPILQRSREQNRERMWVYVKLFLVMGITWLTEVISWQEGTCEAWIITDVINALQGVSIFAIFICKRNLLKKIRSKWEPYLRRVKEVVGSKRLSHSRFSTSATGNIAREQLSFSSSENRPNHSAASHRTVQSQLSFDPSSANRKISTGSLSSTTGVQVHTPNSIPMDTIAESNIPETEPNQTSKDSVVLPLEPVIEGNEPGSINHKDTNGEVRRNVEAKGEGEEEEFSENRDSPSSNSDDNDVQSPSTLNHNHYSPETGKEIQEEDVEKHDKNVIKDGSETESKENQDSEIHENTLDESSLIVKNQNKNADIENEFECSLSQDNPAFTGDDDDDDEPIHV